MSTTHVERRFETAAFQHGRMEAGMEEIHAQLQAIIQASPLAIVALNREQKIMMWSPAAERIFGWHEKEVLGRPLPIIPPDKQEEALGYLKRALRGESFIGLELTRQRKDGSRVEVNLSAAPLRDPNGKIVGTLGFLEDITHRKELEREEGQLFEQLRLIIESLPVVVFMAKAGGNSGILYVSPNVKAVTGFEASDFLSKPTFWFERIHPDDLKKVREEDLHLPPLNGDRQYEHRWRVADGSYRHFMHRFRPVKSSDGEDLLVGMMEDVTERRKVEEALTESEQKYRQLVENANEGICVAQEGRLRFVNPRLVKISGYSEEELTTRPFLDFIHPEDRAIVGMNYQKRIRGEPVPEVYAFRFVNKKGEIGWLRISAVVIAWDGKPATLNFLSDITEQRQAEEELKEYREHLEELVRDRTSKLAVLNERLRREIEVHMETKEFLIESEKRYRDVLDTAQEGIWMTDRLGKTTYANQRMSDMIGYLREELFDRLVFDFMDSSAVMEGRKHFERLRRSGMDHCELGFRRKDGKDLWTIASSSSILGQNGEFVGSLMMLTDITERREMEEKVSRSKKMLQTIFDGISDPLVMVDETLTVKMLNKAARDYYRIERFQDVVGKVLDPDFEEKEALGKEIHEAIRRGKDFSFERKSPRDRNRFERIVLYPLREEESGSKAAILRISDITEAKLLEKELIQNEKLSSLGLLVSSLVHEINNPNSFISFNIPILRDYLRQIMPVVDRYVKENGRSEWFGMSYEEFRQDLLRLLDNIEHGANRVNATVSNLREFSRKREGRNLQWIHPKEVIEKAVSICEGELKKKISFFELEIPKPLPPLLTDPASLEQVLVNLLINAIQAADKRISWIGLRAEQASQERGNLTIEVSDNGCGMEEQVLDRIFEPFFTTKRPGTGTGLGLYVSRLLMDELGGKIEVESQAGMGSTFRLILPLSENGKAEISSRELNPSLVAER